MSAPSYKLAIRAFYAMCHLRRLQHSYSQTSNDVSTVDEAAAFVARFQPEGGYSADDIKEVVLRCVTGVRAAVKRLHPDRNGGEATPDWHRLQSAMSLLNRHHGGTL